MRLAAVLVVISLGAAEARACSCKSATPEEVFELADVVFVGSTVAREPSSLWVAPFVRLGATTFEVAETFKDDYYAVQDSGRFSLADRDDSCAVSFEPGRQYLVFAWRTDGQLATTTLCAGNKAVSDTSATLARVRAVAASWTYPDPPRLPDATHGGVNKLATSADVAGPPFPWWSVALNVVLGITLLLVWTRRCAQAS